MEDTKESQRKNLCVLRASVVKKITTEVKKITERGTPAGCIKNLRHYILQYGVCHGYSHGHHGCHHHQFNEDVKAWPGSIFEGVANGISGNGRFMAF